MKHKRLQFLVPQYKETEDVIKFLLDSIESQLYIDKSEFGVIICSDGGNYKLNKEFLDSYSYDIDYVICKHRGVSATRNSAILLSDADYIMFCDADDGFCNTFGLKIIFENLKSNEESGKPLDILASKFFVENSVSDTVKWGMQIIDNNNTYIHGRVYRRDFLVNYSLFFNEDIWANEDSFFSIITGFYSKNTKIINIPFYCWRGNPDSVSRDPKFLLKTMHQLIHSNDSVVEAMLLLKKDEKDIAKTTFDMICKLYLEMNKPEWHYPENKEYKDITLKTLQNYIEKRGTLCTCLTDKDKKDILQKTRSTQHYGNIENITFNDFVKLVMNYGKK